MAFVANKNSAKALSVFSLVMINVIAVDSLRTLPISAEYGFSIVLFYLIAAIVFFIPTAVVAAELATGWPETGGLYVWVREAFGRRCAFFTIWLQWIYNVVWYPTILAFIASTLAFLFAPDLANDKTYLLLSVLTIFWITTLVNCFGMRFSSWISIAGAIFGTILPMLIIIGSAAVWFLSGRPMQIDFSFHSFVPRFDDIRHFVFFTGVLFGLVGMEMSAVHAGDVKNPQRDYPRALLYSTIIILLTLVLSSLSIALVIPKGQLSLVSGLMDAFSIFFQAYHVKWMVPLVAVLISFGGFSGVAAWVIGPTKGLMVAAQDGGLPRLFKYKNKQGVPIAILLLQGIIFTVLCSLFVLFPTINSSYWLLSAMTAQLALLVYIMMFLAAIRLRYKYPNVERAYKIPGGNVGIILIGIMGIISCISAIGLGFLPPETIDVGNVLIYEFILIGGMLLFSLPPLIFGIRNSTTAG